MANPVIGQMCTISFGGGRVHIARIAKVISGTTVNLVMDNDDSTATWDDPTGSPGPLSCLQIASVTKGSGSGQWQDIVTPDPVLADASTIASSAAASAVASAALQSGFTVNTPTRTLNSNFQPSASRPSLCIYTGTWTVSLSVTGNQAGAVELRSDSAATPTTVRADQPFVMNLALGLTIGSTQSNPWLLSYAVPAGHNVRLPTTGAGTFAITRSTEIVM